MNKKIFGIAILLTGVLIFTGAGCVKKGPAEIQKSTNATPAATADQVNVNKANADFVAANASDICNAAATAEAPNAQAKEFQAIFKEAGVEMTFLIDVPSDSKTGETFLYILKGKPVPEKLKNVFEKYGYKVTVSDNAMVATKNNLNFSINFTDKGECWQVSIMAFDGPFKPGGTVTEEECKIMWEITRRADVTKNDMYTAWTNAIKLYNYWYMLAAKYGVAPDVIAKTCRKLLGV